MGKSREQERIERQRGTIERLKKEVSKLRKAIKKQIGTLPETAEEFEQPQEQEQEIKKCPACGGSNIAKLDLWSKTYKVCKDCKWRDVLKNDDKAEETATDK